jgi:hypothetical protein
MTPCSSTGSKRDTDSGALLGAESANHYSSVQLLQVNSSRHQPRRRHDSSGSCCLALTGFNGEKSGGIQPLRGSGDDPAVEAQAVRAAVERDPRLVDPGLGRHRRQHVRGNIRSVHHNKLHLPPEPGGKGSIKISLIDLPTYSCEIPSSAVHRGGIDVCCMKFLHRHLGSNRNAHSSGSTTKINNDAGLRTGSEALPLQCHGFRNEEFRAAARHKNTGINGNAKPTKAGPAKNILKRLTRNTTADPSRELITAGRLGQQQLRFFLGENTAGRPQQGDNFGKTGTGN